MKKNRTRTIEFKLRLSEDESIILTEKWKRSGMKSRNAFLRHLIIYGFVFDVDYSELREYNSQLAHIGNNLNQIAKRANENGLATNSDLKEAKELMDKIWHTQKSMLSKQPLIKQ
ncbi:MAG: MobC family plasmid mobilization relaxosome protein [Eubacteriales bacterium]|nr:MobC family plasmid mobilization relaxosome protein [Eubacteriales bacterium]